MKRVVLFGLICFTCFAVMAEQVTVTLVAVSGSYLQKTDAAGLWIKDDAQYLLLRKDSPRLEFSKFKTVEIQANEFNPEWNNVLFSLFPDDAKRFHEFTKTHVGKQVACFFGEKYCCAPVIFAPISGGQFVLSAKLTDQDKKRIMQIKKSPKGNASGD